ncbi:MAG: hypothetical protein ACI4C3_01165 [Bacteroides sp.]
MNIVQIEGYATISEKGFRFDSGLPSNEPVLDEALKLRGTLNVSENACVEFSHSERIYLPPEVHPVCQGEGYRVKRTSRHYILQVKLPIVEKRAESQERLDMIIPHVMNAITLDRKEVLDV